MIKKFILRSTLFPYKKVDFNPGNTCLLLKKKMLTLPLPPLKMMIILTLSSTVKQMINFNPLSLPIKKCRENILTLPFPVKN